MITQTLAQTATDCLYGDTAEVTHLLETEGNGVQGLCLAHAEAYGYPQYLVSVDDVQADEPTVTLVADGEEITITIEAAWDIFYGVNGRRSQLRGGANFDAQRRGRELKKAHQGLTWRQLTAVANFVDPARTDGLKTKERAAEYLRSIGK